MPAQDSYDALAESIERSLRSDLEPPGSAAHLVGSIDRIMGDEARAGELRLAYLRLVVIIPYAVLCAVPLLAPAGPHPIALRVSPLALAIAWVVGASGFVLALRAGWYRRWIPHLVPIADATMLLSSFVLLWRSTGNTGLSSTEALTFVTAVCTFLSLSGALRLSRWAAQAGATLGVVVFLVAASIVPEVRVLPTLAVALSLLATGLLSVSMTTIVRRVVTDEIARATLAQMYEDAEAAIGAREQVLKVVSHDLRNPLHTISMCASLLLDLKLSPEQQAPHLERIKRAGQRMNKLIEDLLNVAKLEAGRIAIQPRTLEAGPLLIEAHEMLAPLATEKEIRLEVMAAESLPTIMADGGRVIQVLSNLVGNALKFTPKGGRVRIKADAAPGGVRFTVEDTGEGIPPEQLARIFAQFWQADPADRRGIGLGLTIAKGIVEAHGGRIWVESEVGRGTTFHFTLGTTLPETASGARERRAAHPLPPTEPSAPLAKRTT
jgi:signal transduction histidine kinase